MDDRPTGRDGDPPDESGGLGDEPGREPGSDTPHLTRGSGTPQPERASGGHASFDPDLAEGGALPHTDALDPPDSGVAISPEGGPSTRDAAPSPGHGDESGVGTDTAARQPGEPV